MIRTMQEGIGRRLPSAPRCRRAAVGAVAAGLWLLAPGGAAADTWRMDAADSRLEFVARYAGADVTGSFQRFSVALRFDPQRPGDGCLDVRVDVGSADMGDDDLNETVAGIVWLDAAGFATASFVGRAISMRGPGEFLASGTLELKGVRREIAVPFTWNDDGRQASMRGELSLRRLDFGIGTGTWTATDEVADEVRVRFVVDFDKAG